MSPLLNAPRVQTGGLLLAPSSKTKVGWATKDADDEHVR
jgi:hypothetical protein